MPKLTDPVTTMRSVASGFSYVMDLVNSEIEDHHQKVAFLSYRLAEELGLPPHACRLAFIGGLLHDIGGVLSQGRLTLADLEANAVRLADSGANIVKLIPVQAPLAEIVRYSQSPADDLTALTRDFKGPREFLRTAENMPEDEKRLLLVPAIGQIVHLSDVAVLLFDGSEAPLNQIVRVRKQIEETARVCTHFHPWALDAFRRLCGCEAVWLDLAYEPSAFLEFIPGDAVITLENLGMLSEFASVIIDFRSPFTAMHSAGVAASAVELARILKMPEEDCVMMKIAGHLHDIGKLKIPKEILEKPGKLTDEEFNIIKEHPYFSWKILKNVDGPHILLQWAALHHEKLDGSGYPFHLRAEELCLGARVMAVADIFAAVTEDRPYRAGMRKEDAVRVLAGDAKKGAIDPDLVQLLADNYEKINEARAAASRTATERYALVRGK